MIPKIVIFAPYPNQFSATKPVLNTIPSKFEAENLQVENKFPKYSLKRYWDVREALIMRKIRCGVSGAEPELSENFALSYVMLLDSLILSSVVFRDAFANDPYALLVELGARDALLIKEDKTLTNIKGTPFSFEKSGFRWKFSQFVILDSVFQQLSGYAKGAAKEAASLLGFDIDDGIEIITKNLQCLICSDKTLLRVEIEGKEVGFPKSHPIWQYYSFEGVHGKDWLFHCSSFEKAYCTSLVKGNGTADKGIARLATFLNDEALWECTDSSRN